MSTTSTTTPQFLVPDYFPAFRCKMGACRHTCCEDWPICISMSDYFKLLGDPCSADLRRRIDTALHILDHPTPQRYAQITPRYDGNCAMRLPDGRCGLHAELGEDALSNVCRLYPRGIRHDDQPEASCANSCEAVLESFLDRLAPLDFIRIPVDTQHVPPAPPRTIFFETAGREQDIRLHLIRILQNRELSLPLRLLSLGDELRRLKRILAVKDTKALARLLDSPLPAAPQTDSPPLSDSLLVDALHIAERMVTEIAHHAPRLADYGNQALDWFTDHGQPLEQYRIARQHFETLIPNWQNFLEHALINHAFFERFPFQDRPLDIDDEQLGLCAVYALLRFLGLGCLSTSDSPLRYIDLCAAAFRHIDHTAFDLYGAHLLKSLGCQSLPTLFKLIRL